jgi:hypothetical protein
MEIGFFDHFGTRLVTTSNYSAIANFNTLQFTTAYAKLSQSVTLSTSRFLLWLLTVEILQLPHSCHCRLATVSHLN